MSTRKPTTRNRALRPTTESLEDRQLLSGVVSGTDIDGDQWVLQLIGPGSLVVAKQPGADGTPAPLNSQTQIKSITIGGLDPQKSRLVGQVTKGTNGDGKVFFQQLDELPSKSQQLSGATGPSRSRSPTSGSPIRPPPAARARRTRSQSRFRTGSAPCNSAVSTPRSVRWIPRPRPRRATSLPSRSGCPSSAEPGSSSISRSAARSRFPPPEPRRRRRPSSTVSRSVSRAASTCSRPTRLSGTPTRPPASSSTRMRTPRALEDLGDLRDLRCGPLPGDARLHGGLTGQIGNVRIGGNATNFSTLVFDATGTGQAKITQLLGWGRDEQRAASSPPTGSETSSLVAGWTRSTS